MTAQIEGCELCVLASGLVVPGAQIIVQHEKFVVILAEDANYPGFARVVWRAHVREMSDLADADRLLLNEAVWRLELAVRDVMQPLKVNVASLGNVVPHLHWHVIARFDWDSHFPAPVWAAPVRDVAPAPVMRLRTPLPELDARVARAVAALAPGA